MRLEVISRGAFQSRFSERADQTCLRVEARASNSYLVASPRSAILFYLIPTHARHASASSTMLSRVQPAPRPIAVLLRPREQHPVLVHRPPRRVALDVPPRLVSVFHRATRGSPLPPPPAAPAAISGTHASRAGRRARVGAPSIGEFKRAALRHKTFRVMSLHIPQIP